MAKGKRPAPFRTRKLRPSAPMVLQVGTCGRVGHRRTFNTPVGSSDPTGVFLFALVRRACCPADAASRFRGLWNWSRDNSGRCACRSAGVTRPWWPVQLWWGPVSGVRRTGGSLSGGGSGARGGREAADQPLQRRVGVRCGGGRQRGVDSRGSRTTARVGRSAARSRVVRVSSFGTPVMAAMMSS